MTIAQSERLVRTTLPPNRPPAFRSGSWMNDSDLLTSIGRCRLFTGEVVQQQTVRLVIGVLVRLGSEHADLFDKLKAMAFSPELEFTPAERERAPYLDSLFLGGSPLPSHIPAIIRAATRRPWLMVGNPLNGRDELPADLAPAAV